jgi:hypothetical protein
MIDWGIVSKERQERLDRMVSEYLSVLDGNANRKEEFEKVGAEQVAVAPAPAPSGVKPRTGRRKKPAFQWLSAAAACVLCMSIVLPIALNKRTHPDDKDLRLYTAEQARIKGMTEGFFFDNVYALMKEDEDMLVFDTVIYGKSGQKEVYDDKDEELLSYVLYDCMIDVGTESEPIIFMVNYRIRFVPQYTFIGYHVNYKNLQKKYTVRETVIKCEIVMYLAAGKVRNKAFIFFTYGKCDYFIEVSDIETDSSGILTPLDEKNLILLLDNLIPKGE